MKRAIQLMALAALGAVQLSAADKKIILVAGGASHGSGDHEHRAGCELFKACLDKVPGINVQVYSNGWVPDVKAFDGADAIVVYSDGGGGHPFIQKDRLQVLSELMKKGVGLGCVHYAVEVPTEKGGKEWLDWIGGYFEVNWSVNPFWVADFTTIPKHPVTRGVKPFKIQDEWYYHMRFQPEMKGVTPILSALPPKATLNRRDGPHENNPAVREAVLTNQAPQHVMWVYERPDGGRGFGFTGGHPHKNWANDDFRKPVLNAILWIAKVEVPANGVETPVPQEALTGNLDQKGKK
ncbi:MAG: ThuA domain-containing protein [Verrucomicrobia bacterium]|nr:ThuA domain-containing protein [Verrucomicrobiota bacterium]